MRLYINLPSLNTFNFNSWSVNNSGILESISFFLGLDNFQTFLFLNPDIFYSRNFVNLNNFRNKLRIIKLQMNF